MKALRKIDEVVLINWMSHEHSVIKFHKGMNVITGTSDSGKSAVYRALEYLYHMGQEGYRSFHPGWVRHKASNATIRVKYDDGYMIERVKGDKNEVRLYKDDGPDERILIPIKGRPPRSGDVSMGCRFAPRCNAQKDICMQNPISLEIFSGAESVRCLRWRDL